jgi:4-amino-4-deoxy-L-arabinose transferase-like glycosyltransferase
MAENSFLYWVVLILMAALLDLALMAWMRRRSQRPGPGEPLHRFGIRSPVWTWFADLFHGKLFQTEADSHQKETGDPVNTSGIQESPKRDWTPQEPPSASAFPPAPASTPAQPERQAADQNPGQPPPLLEIEFHLKIHWPCRRGERPAVPPHSVISPAGASQVWLQRLDRSFADLFAGSPWPLVMLAVLAMAAGYSAQVQLIEARQLTSGVSYLLAAGSLFTLAALAGIAYLHLRPFGEGVSAHAADGERYMISNLTLRRDMIWAALGLAGINVILLSRRPDNAYQWDIFALWLASMVIILLAFLPRGRPQADRFEERHSTGWLAPALLTVIVILGAFLRFYQLGAIPLVMENDEGIVGMKAVEVLNGTLKNMFATFGGYGTLEFFLMALPVKLLGQTRLAVRLITAIAGIAAIPMIYLLAKRLFDQRVALVSAVLLAFSHFHIQFSRVSPTAGSLDPLLFTVTLYCIYKGIQERRMVHWVLGGLAMGLGMFFYVGARAVAVVAAGYLIALAVLQRGSLKENERGIFALAGAYLVAVAPMIPWAAFHADQFNARIRQMGILQNGWLAREVANTGQSTLSVMAKQTANALLIFNYHPARWYYEARVPMLGLLTGALFVMGAMYALLRIRDRRFLLLNVWFWGTFIPGQVLVVDPAPSAYRTLGLLPAVCIMAALALVTLAELVFSWLKKGRRVLVTAFIVALLAVEAVWNLNYYFRVWAPAFLYSDVKSRTASLVGDFLAGLPKGTQVYLIGGKDLLANNWSSLKYLSAGTQAGPVQAPLNEALDEMPVLPPAVFVFTPDREREMAIIEQAYPGGRRFEENVAGTSYFLAYELGLPPATRNR